MRLTCREDLVITGAHAILYSTDAAADRAFLRDVLGTTTVDAGGGWLILALPPAEIAVHPTDGPARHELYLMCDHIDATVAELRTRGVGIEGGISDERWGRMVTVRLPGGGVLGVYEPRHPVAAGT
jgi:catechol 2,3-dioxygenase-like lactoylglutathione lyase family enzyme